VNEVAIAILYSVALPALRTHAGEQAGTRFLELFKSNIRNLNTRRAYAVGDFIA
jgi:hypothetical protein